jgi:type IV secretion system protein VirD4
MVSRQETARPLLTPGEVMQLPPADEVVLVSGLAPIRANKLRYFEDPNFADRVIPAPELADNRYLDRPKPRANDWNGRVCETHAALAAAAEDEAESAKVDHGGLQQQRSPEIAEEQISRPKDQAKVDQALIDDETDLLAEKAAIDPKGPLSDVAKAHAMNEGQRNRAPDHELMQDF